MGFTLRYRIERHASINSKLDRAELDTTTPASIDYGNARHIAMASPRLLRAGSAISAGTSGVEEKSCKLI
jgi:hypothetical protein